MAEYRLASFSTFATPIVPHHCSGQGYTMYALPSRDLLVHPRAPLAEHAMDQFAVPYLTTTSWRSNSTSIPMCSSSAC